MDIKTYFYNSQYKAREWVIGNYFRLMYGEQDAIPIDPSVFQPKKVLFVMNGLLGDSVMSVPAIIKARELWQNAHFTLLGKKRNCELLAACPLINEFYETAVDPFSWRKSADVKKLQKRIAAGRFDLAIVLLGYEFAPLLAKAKIPIRVGFKETRLAPCFTITYEYKGERTWAFKERLDALRALGYRFEDVQPKLWILDEARTSARKKLRDLGLAERENYAILHPFGSTPRQWWNTKNIAPFSNDLRASCNLRTVLIGGPETVSRASEDAEKTLIDSTGRLSLQEMLAVIDDSNLVVTTDSGPFHIAGALQKPIVGLFRARRPEHAGNYPNARVVFGEDASCENLCRWDYCRNNPCCQMQKISVEQAIEAAKLVL